MPVNDHLWHQCNDNNIANFAWQTRYVTSHTFSVIAFSRSYCYTVWSAIGINVRLSVCLSDCNAMQCALWRSASRCRRQKVVGLSLCSYSRQLPISTSSDIFCNSIRSCAAYSVTANIFYQHCGPVDITFTLCPQPTWRVWLQRWLQVAGVVITQLNGRCKWSVPTAQHVL